MHTKSGFTECARRSKGGRCEASAFSEKGWLDPNLGWFRVAAGSRPTSFWRDSMTSLMLLVVFGADVRVDGAAFRGDLAALLLLLISGAL